MARETATGSCRDAFGENLGLYMDKRGASVSDLSAHLGVSVQTVYLYLRGKRFPQPANLRRICLYLGVSADTLLGIKL